MNQAQAMGKEASRFIEDELNMDIVYDYMLHLLTEYAKLLRFQPSKPPGAVEYCAEFMACGARGRERTFMVESVVQAPREAGPCALPPPFDPEELNILARRKAGSIRRVEIWEDKSWGKREKTKN